MDVANVMDSLQLITINNCWLETTKGRESLEILSSTADYKMEINQTYYLSKLTELKDSLLWQLPDDFNQWKIKQNEEVVELTAAELKALALKMKQALNEVDFMEMRGSILAEWLRQFDPVIDQIGVLLKAEFFDDKQKMRIYNALGHLDTPNGNQLLVNLMVDTELTETDRFRAIRAITNGETPLTPELKEQLVDNLLSDNFEGPDDLRGAAIMTLGIVIQTRMENEQSEQLLIDITNKLTASSSEAEQAALVASLGNSNKPDVLDTLKTYSTSNSPHVRANVASSLSQVGTEKAHDMLSGMLYSEGNPKTQQAILGAASSFSLSEEDMSKVASIASTSKSERTRGNAIKALSKQTQQPELAKQKIRTLMKQENSRKNFVLAAKALTALNKQTSEAEAGNNGG